jgi:hypothetical protein
LSAGILAHCDPVWISPKAAKNAKKDRQEEDRPVAGIVESRVRSKDRAGSTEASHHALRSSARQGRPDAGNGPAHRKGVRPGRDLPSKRDPFSSPSKRVDNYF